MAVIWLLLHGVSQKQKHRFACPQRVYDVWLLRFKGLGSQATSVAMEHPKVEGSACLELMERVDRRTLTPPATPISGTARHRNYVW